MAPPSPLSALSPKPALTNELSAMEEGKNSSYNCSVTAEAPTNLHKIVAELVGTFILIFMGVGSILINSLQHITIVGIAVVWGMVVMALIYTLAHISGAHFNPAITIALAVSRKLPWKQVPTYVGSQLLGSILATLTLYVLFHKQVEISTTVNQYSDPITALEAVIWEFILSFILMFVVLGVATDHRAAPGLSGVAVGGTILFNVIVGGPMSGCSMNPARSIGPALVAGKFSDLWVYVMAPILGMIAATFVYGFMQIQAPVPDKTEETTKGT